MPEIQNIRHRQLVQKKPTRLWQMESVAIWLLQKLWVFCSPITKQHVNTLRKMQKLKMRTKTPNQNEGHWIKDETTTYSGNNETIDNGWPNGWVTTNPTVGHHLQRLFYQTQHKKSIIMHKNLFLIPQKSIIMSHDLFLMPQNLILNSKLKPIGQDFYHPKKSQTCVSVGFFESKIKFLSSEKISNVGLGGQPDPSR